jgi:hypothetical protein
VVYTILFFTYQVATIIWMYAVPWRKRRIMFKKDEQNRSQFAINQTNSNSTLVDVVEDAIDIDQRQTDSIH